jgi:hypothetical protein
MDARYTAPRGVLEAIEPAGVSGLDLVTPVPGEGGDDLDLVVAPAELLDDARDDRSRWSDVGREVRSDDDELHNAVSRARA